MGGTDTRRWAPLAWLLTVLMIVLAGCGGGGQPAGGAGGGPSQEGPGQGAG
ncbi:hypothetical protein DYI95_009150 [Thermaerobacter sp. PB12/4term]|uniref:hypothetical protein n=1 Tax=Thermaerobacter sp. PB12/4term TaxID=2293838 RepID=UPI0013142EEF|nr:hypothetical protein [Thermaerobacter sp. PB12/4term]QIA27655.1 hypothetical protein DYI95_009150 [Thermaerobacter sp. PB12/4term]